MCNPAIASMLLQQLPTPPEGRTGWPWTIETVHLPAGFGERAWPKISIVTPSFNQGQFIEETIRSVILQNYPNLEFIIADGGSTDETVSIIKKYTPWISSWSSAPDGGQVRALNKALQRTSGVILNWLNSDDLLLPGALFAVAELFLLRKDVDLVSGARLQRSAATGTEEIWMPWPKQWPMIALGFPLVPQETTFFSRRLWDAFGAFDPTLDYAFDGAFFSYAISKAKEIVFTSTPIGIMHAYSGQKSLRSDQTMAKNRARLKEIVLSNVPFFIKPLVRLCYTRFAIPADAILRCILHPRAEKKMSVGVYDWTHDRWALEPFKNFI
jgi:glycosyltransferase involved in cell wall biosynthesis